MAPRWTDTTRKHDVTRADAVYAVLHATFAAVLEDEPQEQGQIRLFIGPRHAQALPNDELEILVHEYPDIGQEAVIFHVMPLGAKYRRYREDHS